MLIISDFKHINRTAVSALGLWICLIKNPSRIETSSFTSFFLNQLKADIPTVMLPGLILQKYQRLILLSLTFFFLVSFFYYYTPPQTRNLRNLKDLASAGNATLGFEKIFYISLPQSVFPLTLLLNSLFCLSTHLFSHGAYFIWLTFCTRRVDRQDAMSLMAAISGLSLTFQQGVRAMPISLYGSYTVSMLKGDLIFKHLDE